MGKQKTIKKRNSINSIQIDHTYSLQADVDTNFGQTKYFFRSFVRFDSTGRTLRLICMNTRVSNNHAYKKRIHSSRGRRASAHSLSARCRHVCLFAQFSLLYTVAPSPLSLAGFRDDASVYKQRVVTCRYAMPFLFFFFWSVSWIYST